MRFDTLKPASRRSGHGTAEDPGSHGFLRPAVARLATGFALAMALVGWTDLGLLWFPLQTSSPEWEFGAISAFFESMPLGTIGLVLLALISGLQRRYRSLRVLSVLCWLLAAGFVILLVILVSGVPIAVQSVQGGMRAVLQIAIAKTAVLGLIYIVLYGYTGRACAAMAKELT